LLLRSSNSNQEPRALRDGEIFDKERGIFENAIDGLQYSRAAIVSIKENVPFRIYRMLNAKIVETL
jgi:hypothetical protein